ncbi:MAG: CPBP family intramembrane metalloprotease [Bacteroidetes bacterium]|nr:CPBP family intramembrane metalloprotease [Bacteroidota bacterium]
MDLRLKDLHIIPRMGMIISMFIIFQSVALSLGTLFTYQVLGADTARIQEGILANRTDWLGFMFLQGTASLIGFGLTAVVFSYLEAGNFKLHLGLVRFPSLQLLGMVLLAVLAAQFFVESLVKLNELLPAPEAVLQMEKRIDAMLEAATSFTTLPQFLIAAVVMAVVPAIAEELFFRGLLMGDMLRSGMKPVSSILISGVIFSLVHFEFHNFLAIGVLGIFLGYLYYISGSLWLCVAAHFINNFFAVLARYLVNLGVIGPELAEGETPVWLSVAGGLVFLALVYLIRSFKKPELPATEVDDTEL